MSKETKIEWADSTVNFWSGCTKVSAGCAHCYAEALSNRKLGNIGGWGKGAARKRHQSAFTDAVRLNKKPWVCERCGVAQNAGGVGWNHANTGYCSACKSEEVRFHRRRVFSLSLGDWLDPEVPIEWLAEMLDTIRRCDQLQWLLVTKRPELFEKRLAEVLWHKRMHTGERSEVDEPKFYLGDWVSSWLASNPPTHVMVLTSVEDQRAADERIPALLRIPAAKRGLSCEPLLGPVDFPQAAPCGYYCDHDEYGGGHRPGHGLSGINWVIVGGESGAEARPCAMDWIAEIQRQCVGAAVPVFVKQLGKLAVCENANLFEFPNDEMVVSFGQAFASARLMTRDPKGGDINEWPDQLRVRKFPEV